MNNLQSTFHRKVMMLRESASTTSEFGRGIASEEIFQQIVAAVTERTLEFGKLVGLIETKGSKAHKAEETDEASELETNIKKFFTDHSFSTANEARNLADLIKVLTGVNATKFISLKSSSKDRRRFPAYIVVVPSEPSGSGHDYKIGKPIMSLSPGAQFYRENGTSGNSMTSDTAEYRMPSSTEITSIVTALMYRLRPFTEIMCDNLLSGDAGSVDL